MLAGFLPRVRRGWLVRGSVLFGEDQLAVAGETKPVFLAFMFQDYLAPAIQEPRSSDPRGLFSACRRFGLGFDLGHDASLNRQTGKSMTVSYLQVICKSSRIMPNAVKISAILLMVTQEKRSRRRPATRASCARSWRFSGKPPP